MKTRGIRGLATLSAVAILIAGCATEPDPATEIGYGDQPAFGGPTNPGNSSTPQRTPEERAEAEAKEAITRYMSVYNAVNSGEEPDPAKLDAVSGDPLLEFDKGDIQLRRSMGIESNDSLRIVSMRVVRAELPEGDAGQADYEFVTCVDHRDYRSVFPDGRSDVLPEANAILKRQYWVRNPEWPRGEWKVVGQSITDNPRCPE